MARKTRFLLLALPLGSALVLWVLFNGCVSPPAPQKRRPELGQVESVLDGPGLVAELVGFPSVFLVGDGSDVDSLLARRSALVGAWPDNPVVTLVDESALDDLKRGELGDQLLASALDPGGPILVDSAGRTALALRDGQPGVWLIRISDHGEVVSSLVPGMASREEMRTVLEGPSAPQ
ncbi:MAG: hypothetical protein ACE5H3_07195 [Planctomycetota bacterium]